MYNLNNYSKIQILCFIIHRVLAIIASTQLDRPKLPNKITSDILENLVII